MKGIQTKSGADETRAPGTGLRRRPVAVSVTRLVAAFPARSNAVTVYRYPLPIVRPVSR